MLQQVILSPYALQGHFLTTKDKLWTDDYFLVLYISAASVLALLVSHKKRRLPEPSVHASSLVFTFKVVRFVGCLALVFLTVTTLVLLEDSQRDKSQQAVLLTNFLYASALSAFSLVFAPLWSQVLVRHVNLVLGAQLLVYCYRDIWPLAKYTLIPNDIVEGRLLWAKLTVLFVTAIVVPLFTPRIYVPFDPEHLEPTPEQSASLFSSHTFMFLDHLVYTAYETRGKPLDFETLPGLPDTQHAKNLKEKSFKHIGLSSRSHIFLGLLRVFLPKLLIASMYIVVLVPAEYLGALGINKLLEYLEQPEDATIRPWVWVLALFLGPSITILANESYIYYTILIFIETEAILTQLLFENVLKIRVVAEVSAVNSGPGTSKAAKPSTGNLMGRLNNLITTDMSNITSVAEGCGIILLCPASIILGSYFLFSLLGPSAFVGLGVMILLLPVPGLVNKASQRVRKAQLQRTDARVQRVTETVNILRMIKMFAWERLVEKTIQEDRNAELAQVMRGRLLQLMNTSVNYILPATNMLATYAFYTMVMRRSLSPSLVFSSLAISERVGASIRLLLMYWSNVVSGKVSMDRVNNFLRETELLDSFGPSTAPKIESDIIGFHNATFSWSTNLMGDQHFKLQVGDLVFQRDCLNMIVGPTGSGKSALLLALLGEMHLIPSDRESWFNLPRDGGISYVSQENWILNDTIKNNILFGTPWNLERYNKVIYQCALEKDLSLFQDGDETEIGERGITISGGQRTRIALARAIYRQSDILLLDDPLASLDVETASHIVRNCLSGDLVKGRTVILVTHNIELVSPIVHYCVDVRDGKIWSHGSVLNVLASDSAFFEEMDQIKEQDSVDDNKLENQDPLKPSAKLIVAEEIATGRISRKAFMLYVRELFGHSHLKFLVPITYIVCLVSADVFRTGQSYYLGFWSSLYEDRPPEEISVPYHLGAYSAIMLICVTLNSIDFIIYMFAAIRASRNIHGQLVSAVLGTTFRFLDTTPVSRITTRFTQDITSLDSSLPSTLMNVMRVTSLMIIQICAVLILTPHFIYIAVLFTVVGYTFGKVYMSAQLGAKRHLSVAKAPIIAHFGTTLTGLASVRAYEKQQAFIQDLFARTDRYTRTRRPNFDLIRWVSIRLEILSGGFTALLGVYCLYRPNLGSGNAGFSLTQASAFSAQLLWWVYIVNQLEVQANSLERLQHYIDVEQEPKATESGRPPAYFPASGAMEIVDLSASYSRDGPKILNNIAFSIESGQHIGIAGRTGSGKSSLALALLRAIHTEGSVYLDGLETSAINLDALRTSITLIPQQPELLSGTLRYNLDPFGLHDDATLNDALRSAGLMSLQTEDPSTDVRITLDSNIAAGGSNVSPGERQILAFARAILKLQGNSAKVIIMDEATSAVDYKTDAIIRNFLQTQLSGDTTVITIAHRLSSIMQADKILVLDEGRLVEFGTPKELLMIKDGKLRVLVNESRDKSVLETMAEQGSTRTSAS